MGLFSRPLKQDSAKSAARAHARFLAAKPSDSTAWETARSTRLYLFDVPNCWVTYDDRLVSLAIWVSSAV